MILSFTLSEVIETSKLPSGVMAFPAPQPLTMAPFNFHAINLLEGKAWPCVGIEWSATGFTHQRPVAERRWSGSHSLLEGLNTPGFLWCLEDPTTLLISHPYLQMMTPVVHPSTQSGKVSLQLILLPIAFY